MPLTVTEIKNSKPKDKTYRLFDGGGMYLEVSPKGGKWWRLKYRFNGKEKRLSLGVYPEISLKDARERRTDAKRLLADDIDPAPPNNKGLPVFRVALFYLVKVW